MRHMDYRWGTGADFPRASRSNPPTMLATTRRLALLFSLPSLAAAQATLYHVEGPAPEARLGISLQGAGDVNSDGALDWVSGGDHGASLHSGVDGAHLLTIPAPVGVNTFFGREVVVPGDLDGDGVTEIVIGDSLDVTGGPSTGTVQVLLWRERCVAAQPPGSTGGAARRDGQRCGRHHGGRSSGLRRLHPPAAWQPLDRFLTAPRARATGKSVGS